MESIWNNTFYNTAPALSWTYKVDFTNLFGKSFFESQKVYTDYNNYLKILGQAVVSVNVGQRESEAVDVNYGGVTFKKITRANNTGNLDFTFNEDNRYTVTTILQKIYEIFSMKQYYPESVGEENDFHPYNDQSKLIKNAASRLIIVRCYNSGNLDTQKAQTITKEYKFYGCQLQGMDDFELSYESAEAITRSASFLYDYMIVEDHDSAAEG